jgi:hypothetical protein
MDWQDRVAGCFGNNDVEFAVHPMDQRRAKELIAAAQAAGATRDDFEKEMEWHVYKNRKYEMQAHLEKQVKRLHKMWKV